MLAVCIIPLVQGDQAPEFDLRRPFGSAVAVIRTVLFSPRSFYLNFKVEGPLKEPAVFVLLVGTFSAILGAAVALSSNFLFAVLSPVGVGVVAGVYLLSIKTFVGKASGFTEVYRMAAYAAAVLVFAWIPILGAFAFTYALMILMGIGI